MTLEGIIKEFNIDSYIFISKENAIRLIQKAKYLDVYEYIYNIFNPEENIWVDIEGIGYGCLWANTKLREHSEILQRRAIKKFALSLVNELKINEEIICYMQDKDSCYGFLNSDGTKYTRIRISNKELDGKV